MNSILKEYASTYYWDQECNENHRPLLFKVYEAYDSPNLMEQIQPYIFKHRDLL